MKLCMRGGKWMLKTPKTKRIALVGMMGSGKTKVAKNIAKWLGWNFIDTDEIIEKKMGMTIKEIFKKIGEKYFRKLEKQVLKEVLEIENCVISTGGGMILFDINRELLKKKAKTYFLEASIDTLKSRLDISNRPLLLNEDVSKVLLKIWKERERFYKEFESIETDGLSVNEVSMKVILKFLESETEEDSNDFEAFNLFHPIRFGLGRLKKYIENVLEKNDEVFFIVSKRVHKLISEYFKDHSKLIVEDGEQLKNFDELKYLYDFLLKHHASRNSTIIGVGGGTVTDVVGFVAATFKRGCKVVFIPTTLLAQVDAAIGGKNAVNFGKVKNIVGTFKMPNDVYIDPILTLSMDDGRFEEGLVEALKMTIIKGEKFELFENIELDETRRVDFLYKITKFSALKKLEIVEKDPYDRNVRRFLNFGHTIGHAFESTYSITHGQAVAIGMIAETKIGVELKITDEKLLEKLRNILKKIISLPKVRTTDEVINKILNDKKNTGQKINMVIPKTFGDLKIKSFTIDELEKLIKWEN